MNPISKELENEVESRAAQNPESLRGVHGRIIMLTEQMAQNYLSHVRRLVHRFNNLVADNRRSGLTPNSLKQPRQEPSALGESIVQQLQEMTKGFREFTLQWSRTLGKQQSPLIDRIPPRGVELWRDFWDTVRKQMRRINEEFLQLSRDVTRVLTGRQPSNGTNTLVVVRPRESGEAETNLVAGEPTLGSLLYASMGSLSDEQAVQRQFQEFYDKLTVQLRKEQLKMDELTKASGEQQQQVDDKSTMNVIEELDDEQTKLVLTQNPGLRQQINQDINVFSSIFDIIRTFLSRLRGSAEDIRNILERPGGMRDNNAVTPGPAVKPTVDQLLKDTLDAQRNINSQASHQG